MPFKEYENYDALGLADLVARGEVTSSELVEEAITRIDAHNPSLNAVVHRMDDHGRAHAKSSLVLELGSPFRVIGRPE
ncbi:MAG: hypothetical protein GY811_20795 [Myxococcales bacterium]|nr:hypothetical protein [Myxococcales bacterium]